MQSRFSYSHIVASLLAIGSLDQAFTPDGIANAKVQALERKVRLVHDRGLNASYPASQPAHLTLIAASGKALHGVVCGRERNPTLSRGPAFHSP